MLEGRILIHRIRCAFCFALSLFSLAAQPAHIGGIHRLDPAVNKVVPPNAVIEKAAGNLQFAEGPVWVRDGGYLLFSDIPANAIMKWIPSGQLILFRKPVFLRNFTQGLQIGTNGLTLDREGRLIACEHGNRRVSRTEKDGNIVTLADRYQGKRFNSPNDVICKSDSTSISPTRTPSLAVALRTRMAISSRIWISTVSIALRPRASSTCSRER